MALETGVTYIEDLEEAWPIGSVDTLDEADNHMRNIKTAVKGSFPNLGSAAVTATAAEINLLDGLTATQAQLNGISPILLETQTASASSSIDFITGIDSTYSVYEIELINVVPTTAEDIYLRVSDDGGSTFKSGASDYSWSINPGILVTNSSSSFIPLNHTGVTVSNTAADGGLNGRIKIYNPNSASIDTVVSGLTSHPDGSFFYPVTISGAYLTAAAIDGLRIISETSTIASGTFKLYGIK